MQLLKDRIQLAGMEDKFGDILVPTEEVVCCWENSVKVKEKILRCSSKMQIHDHTWHLVREIPRVIGFTEDMVVARGNYRC